MVGIGGINKRHIDRKRCGICGKEFKENESKTMYPDENFFRCSTCDDGKIKPR
jgi:NAD-dependent SIR2 family protein deacetylase